MSKKTEEQSKIQKPSLDRAGQRAFMGNPEEFKLSFYGIFRALIPIIILGIIVWLNW